MPATPAPTEPTKVGRPPARRGRGHIDSFGDGRTCLTPGCETTISRYNREPVCWRHIEEHKDALRAAHN
jgi:hypothetical protein